MPRGLLLENSCLCLGRLAPPLGNERDSLATRPLSRSRVAPRATPVAADRPRCGQQRQARPPTTPRSVVHELPPGGPEPHRPCRPLLVQRARFFLSAEAEADEEGWNCCAQAFFHLSLSSPKPSERRCSARESPQDKRPRLVGVGPPGF